MNEFTIPGNLGTIFKGFSNLFDKLGISHGRSGRVPGK